jgi:hypothetical protein
MLDMDAQTELMGRIDSSDSFSDPPSLDEVLPSGDPLEATVKELILTARRVLANVRKGSKVSPRVQAQARAVVDELGEVLRERGRESDVDITVADDGTWFEAAGTRVDVARRGAVRRILAALASSRLESASRALTVDELFQIGWPGERIPYESQVRRVYTAIWTLRTLGLEGLLLTRDEGYLLDPKKQLARAA